jgi:hypothetical protein
MSTRTITKTYASVETLKNVKEDLVGTGIEQDHIYIDKDKKQVKVITPLVIEAEIEEILGRHKPVD